MNRYFSIILLFGFLAVFAPVEKSYAADYNIHLFTDSDPDYTDMQSFIDTATGLWTDPQDKAIAIWRWSVRNRKQTSATKEKGRGLWDPIKFFNSYANTFCGYIAAMNTSFWYAGMGNETWYVQLGDHTVSEVSWDGGTEWHLFDSSMCIYCYRNDGVVASCQDIHDAKQSPLSLWLGESGDLAGHDYLYNFAKECGSNPVNPLHTELGYQWGYRVCCDRPYENNRTLRNGADSYTSGFTRSQYLSHRRWGSHFVLDLHPYQVYTRYYGHLGETADYWREMTNGNDPDTYGDLGNMRANGKWEFEPDLSTSAYRKVIYSETGVVHATEDGGGAPYIRPAAAGTSGEVVFKVNGANVITSADIHIEGIRNTGADTLAVSYSWDGGAHWTQLWTAGSTGAVTNDIHLDSSQIGGEYQYLVRVEMTGATNNDDAGLNLIRMETITQCNRLTLPNFQLGANTVNFSLGEQYETFYLWPAIHNDQYLDTSFSSSNVFSHTSTDIGYAPCVHPYTENIVANITWKFDAPADILGLYYGGTIVTRNTDQPTNPTHRSYVKYFHSFDGSSYVEDMYEGSGSEPFDKVRHADITGVPAGTKSAWLRYEFEHYSLTEGQFNYGSDGLEDVMMYVYYTPRDPRFQPVEVTFNWTEHRDAGDVTRQHTYLATKSEEQWNINVDGYKAPTMNWVRINLKGYGPDGAGVTYGYSDGDDVGTGAGYDKKKYDFSWMNNVAFQKSYTVSRAADGSNPDTGGTELTDGNIVPPTPYSTASGAQGVTALWAGDTPVTVTIDLGGQETIAAFRIVTHQPNSNFCHADHINIEVSDDGSTYTPVGTINHNDIWKPPGNFVGHEHDNSPNYDSLPAGGRFSFPFWYVLGAPIQTSYIRCTFYPISGHGVGISEIMALSSVNVIDWPDRGVKMPAVTDLAADTPAAVPQSGDVPLNVSFSVNVSGGSGSNTYDWDFGDGATSTNSNPSHIYTTAGVYYANVVVTDSAGKKTWAEVTVYGTTGGGYTISGTISGVVADGVTVTMSGDLNSTTTTAGGGLYSFTGLPPGNFTVTPSLAGYMFNPASSDVAVVNSDQTGIDFTSYRVYSISGTVSGDVTEGVTVTLSGDSSAVTTTGAGGTYTFSDLPNGSYTVTPSLADFEFANPSEAITISSADVTGVDFTAYAVYSISGTVSGDVSSGVTLTLSGDGTGTVVSQSGGGFSFTACRNGLYTVTPSLSGYVFSPTSRSVTVTGSNVTGVNFTAQLVHSISGTVSGDAAAGVALTLGGDATDSTVSLAGGAYTFTGLQNGSYTVTPSLAGYEFSPAVWGVTVNGSDVTSIDFTATQTVPGSSIRGVISGDVTAGVTVTLSGTASAATVSGAGGVYSFPGLSDGSYTITPSLNGYTFSPASRNVIVSGSDQTGVDFVSAAVANGSISGSISGDVTEGVTLTLGGAGSAATLSATDGTYSFTGLSDGNYTVTPTLAGYTFSPASWGASLQGGSAAGIDFTASGSAPAKKKKSSSGCRLTGTADRIPVTAVIPAALAFAVVLAARKRRRERKK